MRISGLSTRSGLPVATIKYYLREGLLHAGEATAATQARYDESHVRRLRLIRALTDVAGLRLEAVRDVLDAVDDPHLSWHDAVGAAHSRLARTQAPQASARARARADSLIRRRNWQLHPDGPHSASLAHALDALDGLDMSPSDELLDLYAAAVEPLAEREVGAVEVSDRVSAAEHVVVGTLLLEPVLLSIRRMAQEAVSARTRR